MNFRKRVDSPQEAYLSAEPLPGFEDISVIRNCYDIVLTKIVDQRDIEKRDVERGVKGIA